MTLNLTELRDEPLGKHPSHGAFAYVSVVSSFEAQQDVVAADDESSFTFDVEGLGDEALDPRVYAAVCVFMCCMAAAWQMTRLLRRVPRHCA